MRGLVAHEDGGFEEWGVSGAVRLSPDVSGRGLSLMFAPVWGDAASAAERLWMARDAGALGLAGGFEPEARLEGELGYGIDLPGLAGVGAPGVVTPYAGFTAAADESRACRDGAR